MPRGDKSSYTDKQERQAQHIEQGYESRGVSEHEAERRAWATVNAEAHGGKQSGSGRRGGENHEPSRRGGEKGSHSQSRAERSRAAKKGWETRRRHGEWRVSHYAALTEPRTEMAAIELETYLRDSTRAYHACLEACVECMVACEMCSDACLDEPNVRMMVRCIRLDRDCAAACAAAARAMARGGPLAVELCRACAEACAACAEECERHAAEHDHCRICAEACRRCERECRTMAGAAGG